MATKKKTTKKKTSVTNVSPKQKVEDRHIFMAVLVVVVVMIVVLAYMRGMTDTLNALPVESVLE